MSVTAATGFTASGVVAGLKTSGKPDVALVVNSGPLFTAAGVLTGNRVKAAPVVWTQKVLADGLLRAVILNSGGANACTGPGGFGDTVRTAADTSALLGCEVDEVAVCSTGLIGERLAMDELLAGVALAYSQLSATGGAAAAEAIMTTDTVPKTAASSDGAFAIGGMAKGAGMLAPGLATMLCVITTDAVVAPEAAHDALVAATATTFDRIDSDGCMSTNDTVLLMASGASGHAPSDADFQRALTKVCASLARQLIADAEGASKDIRIEVVNAASEDEATAVARVVSRSNLLKCAIHGEDPNWGRVLSAVGTTSAAFDPDELRVAINGVWVCEAGGVGADRDLVDLSGREVVITVDLSAGRSGSAIWTNDLTAAYVHENSAYSS
jgi:glutamate N-acetyltransferase/amino-acid N-acetyltransferase